MKTKRAASRSRAKGLTLGLEGIRLSPQSREMFAEFDRRGLSNEEQDKAIFKKFKKKA